MICRLKPVFSYRTTVCQVIICRSSTQQSVIVLSSPGVCARQNLKEINAVKFVTSGLSLPVTFHLTGLNNYVCIECSALFEKLWVIKKWFWLKSILLLWVSRAVPINQPYS